MIILFIVVPFLILLPISELAKSVIVGIVMLAELIGGIALTRTIIKNRRHWANLLWILPLLSSFLLLAPYLDSQTHNLELELVATLPTRKDPSRKSIITFYEGCYTEGVSAELQHHCAVDIPEMDLESYTYIYAVGCPVSDVTYNIWDNLNIIMIPNVTCVYDGMVHYAQDTLSPYIYVYRTSVVSLDIPLFCTDCKEHTSQEWSSIGSILYSLVCAMGQD